MGKIVLEFEAVYDRGDVVIFQKNGTLQVGIITSYYCDTEAWNSIWYDVAFWKDSTYTYTNGGDIAEHDIICKITDDNIISFVSQMIKNGEIEEPED